MEKYEKYAEIVRGIADIRHDLLTEIRNVLEEKGYGIDDVITSEYVDIKIDMDWDHICVRDNYKSNQFNHVDDCSVDTLLDAYEAAIHAWYKN